MRPRWLSMVKDPVALLTSADNGSFLGVARRTKSHEMLKCHIILYYIYIIFILYVCIYILYYNLQHQSISFLHSHRKTWSGEQKNNGNPLKSMEALLLKVSRRDSAVAPRQVCGCFQSSTQRPWTYHGTKWTSGLYLVKNWIRKQISLPASGKMFPTPEIHS